MTSRDPFGFWTFYRSVLDLPHLPRNSYHFKFMANNYKIELRDWRQYYLEMNEIFGIVG